MAISLDHLKAIFWGKFIEVAFAMYAPGITNPQQPRNFPEGWKLVKNINVNVLLGQKEFIGFVAQSIVEPNQFAVVLHGTEGVADVLVDLEFQMTDFRLVPNGGRTEYGFTRLYETFSFVDPKSGDSQNLVDYLRGLSPKQSFTVTGFSLGAALATLHSMVLASRKIPVEAYLFASPMVGNDTFVYTYNSLVPKSYRIVNQPDIVPSLPGTFLGYRHVNTLFTVNSLHFPQVKRSIRCFHSPDVYVYALGAFDTHLGSCRA